MKKTTLVIFCLVSCLLFFTLATAENIDITSKEAAKFIENPLPNMKIIDTREERQYNEAHIPGAISLNIMSPQFEEKLKTLDPHAPYLVYCNIGRTSAEAFRVMKRLGFTNIYHMKDGITGWNTNSFPLVRTKK